MEKDAAVVKTKSILSTYQAPEEAVLILLIDCKDHLDNGEITEAIHRSGDHIKNKFPLVCCVIIQPEELIDQKIV